MGNALYLAGQAERLPEDVTIVVGGHRVLAPGFTPDQFDRAIKRAHDEGLRVEPTDHRAAVLVTNPTNGRTYTVTRRICSCKAGQRGDACKHRALAIFLADIMHELPQPSAA